MWCVVCALVTTQVLCAEVYQYEDGGYGDVIPDFYDGDEEEVHPLPSQLFTDSDALTRVRRYDGTESVRAFGPTEINDVKGALKQLFAGRKMITQTEGDDDAVGDTLTTGLIANVYLQNFSIEMTEHPTLRPTRSPWYGPTSKVGFIMDYDAGKPILRDTTSSKPTTFTTSTTSASTGTTTSTGTGTSTSTGTTTSIGTSTNASAGTTNSTTPTTTTTRKPTTKSTRFDIEALLAIVANLTYDYDTNLTYELNETLQRFSIPTCKTPTTTVTTTTLTTTEIYYNTTIVSKCFVCGLTTPGIPRNTFCADAFATDFLPLVPIDPKAKGMIARYRKYCRYFDVNNYQLNKSDERAFLGRWTGGCAVRWADLSGVYTQRACRNRLRPVTGAHFASKRMAKLELALSNVDDGCIISPMATLVPLSRGISLYARFHACVCTGSWCNNATHTSIGYYITTLLYFITQIIK